MPAIDNGGRWACSSCGFSSTEEFTKGYHGGRCASYRQSEGDAMATIEDGEPVKVTTTWTCAACGFNCHDEPTKKEHIAWHGSHAERFLDPHGAAAQLKRIADALDVIVHFMELRQ